MSPYISGVVGVLIGFVWNWTMNSLVIWPQDRPAPLIVEEDRDLRAA